MLALKALALTIVLSIGAVLIHYEALRLLSGERPWRPAFARLQVVSIIVGILMAHIAEASLFSLGYWLADAVLHIGGFSDPGVLSPAQYFYFSIETFTTQGVGDLYAVGPLRLVASVEPLIGLMLIGWSTSFTFLVMRRFWRERP